MDAHRASPSRTPPPARFSRLWAAKGYLHLAPESAEPWLHLSQAEEGVLCHRALCTSSFCSGSSTQQYLRPCDA